jgi:hypothetical protein
VAYTKEHLHAAVELNGPIYADQVLTTAEVVEVKVGYVAG